MSDAPANYSTMDFHYFPKLPTEIRRMIWKYALPDPRIIEVCVPEKQQCTVEGEYACTAEKVIDCPYSGCGLFFEVGESKTNPKRANPFPSILHVCKESRSLGWENYDFCLTGNSSRFLDLRGAKYFLEDQRASCATYTPHIFNDRPEICGDVAFSPMDRKQGILFQPNRDTIYFHRTPSGFANFQKPQNGVFPSLMDCLSTTLKTVNIRSVAIDSTLLTDSRMWKRLFTSERPNFWYPNAVEEARRLAWNENYFTALLPKLKNLTVLHVPESNEDMPLDGDRLLAMRLKEMQTLGLGGNPKVTTLILDDKSTGSELEKYPGHPMTVHLDNSDRDNYLGRRFAEKIFRLHVKARAGQAISNPTSGRQKKKASAMERIKSSRPATKRRLNLRSRRS